MTIIKLTLASIKMFYRDKSALFFTLFLPILFMTIFGLADFGKFANVKIGVIDNAQTEESKKLIENLDNIEILDIKQANSDVLKEDIKKGDLDLVIELPKDLVKYHMIDVDIPGLEWPPYLPKPQKPEFDTTELVLYINEGKAQQAQNAKIILKEVFNKLNYQVTGTKEIFTFKEVSISEKNLSYTDYLIPGIIALSIMQMSLMGIIFTLVNYREKGIMKRLQITPIKPMDFTISQVLSRLIISVLQVAILLTVAILFFKITVIGSYGLILLLTILGSIVFIAMGMTISGIAKTQNAAAPIANIVMMPMMFLGNVFFPVNTMPLWLQNIVKYLPLNYLSDAIRQVMIEGAKLSQIGSDLIALLVWTIILVFFASLTFRFKTID